MNVVSHPQNRITEAFKEEVNSQLKAVHMDIHQVPYGSNNYIPFVTKKEAKTYAIRKVMCHHTMKRDSDDEEKYESNDSIDFGGPYQT